MKARPTRTLSSIAVETGFPSHSEFTRAFSRQYGVAPSHWDRVSRLQAETVVASPAEPPDRGPTHRPVPRIVRREACRLAYVRMRTWFQVEVLREGLNELTAWFDSQGLDWKERELVGMSWDHYETTPLDRLHYDLAFAVPPGVSGSGSVGTYELPSFDAVEVHCSGELATVARAWDYLYEEWFPTSRWEPGDLPAMKRFRRRPDELDWASWDLDCSIALRPALP